MLELKNNAPDYQSSQQAEIMRTIYEKQFANQYTYIEFRQLSYSTFRIFQKDEIILESIITKCNCLVCASSASYI